MVIGRHPHISYSTAQHYNCTCYSSLVLTEKALHKNLNLYPNLISTISETSLNKPISNRQLRHETSVPLFYCGNKIWVRVTQFG